MHRKRRHINASPDEWITVHRPKSGQATNNPLGCLALIIIIIAFLLYSC